MHSVKLTKEGFRITFTKPTDKALAGDLEKYSVERWGYHYHPKYGSPKTDLKKEKPASVQVSKDGLQVNIGVTLEKNRVYKLNLGSDHSQGRLENGQWVCLVHLEPSQELNRKPSFTVASYVRGKPPMN